MKEILISIAVLGGCGLLFGVILALVAKFFNVKMDERVPKMLEELPNANCGGCGFSGCAAFAEAVINGNALVNGCTVGGEKCANALAEIMGTSAGKTIAMRARVLCNGTEDCAKRKYIYDGYQSCAAAMGFGGGDKMCLYGCIGYGDCEKKCKFDAISVSDGIAHIDENKCKGCGTCVAVCPKNVIKLFPKDSTVTVLCKSEDKGAQTRKNCETGCIGCKICEKTCQSDAVKVLNNIASIDYDKCTACGLCAKACPQKIISDLNAG